MYTMPLSTLPDGTKRVFFEETSLVGKGSRRLTFEECKKRAYKRLEYLGEDSAMSFYRDYPSTVIRS